MQALMMMLNALRLELRAYSLMKMRHDDQLQQFVTVIEKSDDLAVAGCQLVGIIDQEHAFEFMEQTLKKAGGGNVDNVDDGGSEE